MHPSDISIESIFNSGCNKTKCGKSPGEWILPEGPEHVFYAVTTSQNVNRAVQHVLALGSVIACSHKRQQMGGKHRITNLKCLC